MNGVNKPASNRRLRFTPRKRLTRGDVQPAAAADTNYDVVVNLLERDVQVLRLLGRFGQLRTRHLDALVFQSVKSNTPRWRTIHRLIEADLIRVVEQRIPGGSRGGSPEHCYALTSKGWAIFGRGKYRGIRHLNYHTLTVADVYAAIYMGEQEGWLNPLRVDTEPDSWVEVAGAYIRPDLSVDLGVPATGTRWHLWIEVDLGTERQRQILDKKLNPYIHAYNNRHECPLKPFPQVLWLVTDEHRMKELRRWINATDAPDGLFDVARVDDFTTLLQG